MTALLARRIAGATLGAVAFGVVVAHPAAISEGPRRMAASELAPDECLAPECEPGPPGWVERLQDHFAARLPALEERERRRLARALLFEAEAAGVDPLLVLALIEIESSWDPSARSHHGARGLMQLREPTMRREVERAGLVFDDPHDPVANVRAGIRYLRRLLDAFGREEVALMAYNAGPNRILGYLREGAVPERFRAYPRKVRAELRRVRRGFGVEAAPAVALVPAVRPAATLPE